MIILLLLRGMQKYIYKQNIIFLKQQIHIVQYEKIFIVGVILGLLKPPKNVD